MFRLCDSIVALRSASDLAVDLNAGKCVSTTSRKIAVKCISQVHKKLDIAKF